MSCTSSAVRMPPDALTPIFGPDGLAHQRDVEDGRTALGEAGRGLDEVGLGLLGEAAGDHLLLVGEEAGLDDDLAEGAGFVARLGDAGDVLANLGLHPALERADVDHHVDLASAVPDRPAGLEDLDLRRSGTEREADDRGDADVGVPQVVRGAADPRRVDADGREPEFGRLGAELVDVGDDGVGPQQRVVDVSGEIRRHVGRAAVVLDARRAAGHDVTHFRRALSGAAADAAEANAAWYAHRAHCAGHGQRCQHLTG